ncbi:MAG: AmmeMemoRadiSam system protein A [Treponema sp.]|nr:AmmeMemoRadiSam system protein A [Treponema sp.]
MAIVGAFMVPHPPLIVHEIGRGEENKIAASVASYEIVAKKIAELAPETIVITSPHATLYADYFHISPGAEASGSFSRFDAPNVRFRVTYDEQLVASICEEAAEFGIAAGTKGERDKSLDHGTMVPLYFINNYCADYKVVRIGLSGQSYKNHYMLGKCIKRAAEKTKKRVVFVASGDLSHVLKADGPYGFREEGPQYDERIMKVMGDADFGKLFSFSLDFCENAAECGHRSFVIMAGALDCTAVRAQKLSHESTFGVGYGFCMYDVLAYDERRNFLTQYEAFERSELDARKNNEDEYVRLARATIETYVKTGKTLCVRNGKVVCDDAPFNGWKLSCELLNNRAGAFVSLKKDGMLRGCIGTIATTCSSLAEEIIANAVSAATRDPRFPAVTERELPFLVYSVDVLGGAEKIASKDELDVKRFGVIVTKGTRRGLLLPNLESVNTVEEQIDIACRKAGINAAENPDLERFEVVRHY